MLRPVEAKDLETMRLSRNKWYQLGIFRQDHAIDADEQDFWFLQPNYDKGFIINERAWGRVLPDGEVSFYGFDEWYVEDIKELIRRAKVRTYGECYLNNPFLTLWLEAGFYISGYKKNRKYWNCRMWDSVMMANDRVIVKVTGDTK